ncbi:S8 family serine peptidase [Actinomadura macrotermitis]|uniref:Extracellular serine protease n=1 Tax=Actinomadura macrotermitis TaxID=2585200 RepID=A0A7K0C456_9ACTN|nr:S8 family serine peptidase [Actinomadura macrotermitis]MQY08237.1 Extracellular serine protease [Actinomadura macrotermitis]
MATTKRVQTARLVALTSLGMLPCVVAQSAMAQPVRPTPITSYPGDPGRPGDPASWRTPEFDRDSGLVTIGAEFAYAGGYTGGGQNIGVVDSGYYTGHVREHGSLATGYKVPDRFTPVVASGGDTGKTSGAYDPAYNDSHGTHVTGTIGASRDGVGETTPDGPEANMHGVAFNAHLYVGNTHKTDGVFYGLVPPDGTDAQKIDNGYLANVYRAVATARTKDGRPVRIITSSWGSAPPTENYNTLEPPPGAPASFGVNAAWRNLATPDGVPDGNGNTLHWLNGAIRVAESGKIVQFTAGNAGVANPTARAATPYYRPDLERSWYTTSGVNPNIGRTLNADGSVRVPGRQEFNQCGIAKWSCVTAPSRLINSTWVEVVDGVPRARYRAASGTSMAGPHSAAALSLIMQRFPYMTNTQALHTMYTTGRQNATVSDASGAHVPNPTAGQMVQVPDSRNGWHTVSLREALQGPGQLLGAFVADTRGYTDVWSNDISDVAIQARKQEDAAEAAAWKATKAERGWTDGLPSDASAKDRFDYAVGTRREQARNARTYVGGLVKRGDGTLFLTGANTWHGATTVDDGKLSVLGSQSGGIVVRGGTLGGTGRVAGDVDVTGGTLQAGVSAAEARRAANEHVVAGTVLNVGGDLRVGHHGGLLATVADGAATSVRAAGDVTLSGRLDLDVSGDLTPGTRLTVLSGTSIHGTFRGLREGGVVTEHGHRFKVSYADNSVTLTVIR